ncbi:ABC transporter ATP-binding protein [Butyrivibrio sp. NC2002]|uniref:ABC transporter ATP-binding protein n=1 Tax=Butyrivibrio sp. NC2002 TaxID=1410610 RepID=UPI00056814F4|nr:ABC transporter ATP-binding protein [Butyrivibrio sp. NC2002]
MDKDIAIKVTDLTKVYKLYNKNSDRLKDALGLLKEDRCTEHIALNHVNLEIKRGETIGIIGTNGSGKSTILKIITGVLSPTSGNVEVDGHISALLELGAGFNMEYNGIDNIYLNGMMIGFSEEEIDKRLDAILEFADIGDYVYQPVKTYSSGMFVRLAFAVAINIDPEILIVDEALSVGDVFFQAKCYHKFEEFKQQGKTILFVSHDLSTISRYCDRAVLLNQGVILGEGAPKKMIDIYKQVLVGQYPLPTSDVKSLLEDEDIRAAASKKIEEEKKAAEKESKADDTNPDVLEYGNSGAKITEFYATDAKGLRTNSVVKGTEFTIHMKVKFLKDIAGPIFAYTFKNIMGIEITGTNSMVEKAFLEPVKAGDEKDITFTQRMLLQGGEYLVSFGVTGFEQDDFVVYHRLYDALNITVVSDKNTVGYFDMESTVCVTDSKKD